MSGRGPSGRAGRRLLRGSGRLPGRLLFRGRGRDGAGPSGASGVSGQPCRGVPARGWREGTRERSRGGRPGARARARAGRGVLRSDRPAGARGPGRGGRVLPGTLLSLAMRGGPAEHPWLLHSVLRWEEGGQLRERGIITNPLN